MYGARVNRAGYDKNSHTDKAARSKQDKQVTHSKWCGHNLSCLPQGPGGAQIQGRIHRLQPIKSVQFDCWLLAGRVLQCILAGLYVVRLQYDHLQKILWTFCFWRDNCVLLLTIKLQTRSAGSSLLHTCPVFTDYFSTSTIQKQLRE